MTIRSQFLVDWPAQVQIANNGTRTQVEELAGDWEGKARVYKMDVDSNPNLPVQYGVMGIPALLLFVKGAVAARVAGFKPKKQLLKTFESHL